MKNMSIMKNVTNLCIALVVIMLGWAFFADCSKLCDGIYLKDMILLALSVFIFSTIMFILNVKKEYHTSEFSSPETKIKIKDYNDLKTEMDNLKAEICELKAQMKGTKIV